MSIIFGKAYSVGRTADKRDLLTLAQNTQRFAPDGTFIYVQGRVGMGYQPYNTHQRSNIDVLPLVDAKDNIISFDGRLDNHAELCELLGVRDPELSDSSIVLQLFVRWGADSLSRLVGEWALALWSHSERALYLARDHAGTRSLYFRHSDGQTLWSTYLETFVADGQTYDLNEDYVAHYLSCQPIRELTPYRGIIAVQPAHYVRFRDSEVFSSHHWLPGRKDSIVYETNVEYEEHFFQLFRQSVQRRTGPGAPILAQLSGGMDSASIVCMSDHIRRSSGTTTPLLETVSYYDNSEPNWNEYPFFTAVEASRRKTGIHLDASFTKRTIRPTRSANSLQLWPGSNSSGCDLESRLHNAIDGRNFRAVLSGLGGDEVLGGIPTPIPELADLLVSGRVLSLTKRTMAWCLANRTPFVHQIIETLRFTCDLYFTGHNVPQIVAPWLNPQFQQRSGGFPREDTLWERLHIPFPSRINNANLWWTILETLPIRLLSDIERYEYRFPYLDRDLVEFLFCIPRCQIVEPGRRRSLMRRAFKSIVPNEILERRRKAYLIQGPINLVRREREWLSERFGNLRCAEMGFVDPSSLSKVLDSIAIEGDPKWLSHLMRLISLELWLDNAPIKHSATTAVSRGDQDPSQVVLYGAS
jgi:asparagine synthase (glutamine-hydrolysing)